VKSLPKLALVKIDKPTKQEATQAEKQAFTLAEVEKSTPNNKSDGYTNNKKNSNAIGSSEGLQVSASYVQLKPILRWLMSNGARVMVFNSEEKPIAELLNDFSFHPVAGPLMVQGVWRSANQEIRKVAMGKLPEKTKFAAIHWPNKLWSKVISHINSIENVVAVKARYELDNSNLKITIIEKSLSDGRIEKGNSVFML
jgi:hypothetical protein